MDRKDLRALSRVRLSEARALLKAGLPDGAYYLAGYAVECGLKACIAKETQRYEFPEKKRADASYTHSLKELVRVAELRDGLQAAKDADPLFEETGIECRHGRNRAATARILKRPHERSSKPSAREIME
jgi:HEPN domain-containing protein